jgi:hypothetical protein
LSEGRETLIPHRVPLTPGGDLVRHAVDRIASILDVDRRANQGREVLDRPWPVNISVPVTPMEYDALRFLSSLYPANPPEILRASLLPYLDPGTAPPPRREDGLEIERTARVALGLDEAEALRLKALADEQGVTLETYAVWAVWNALGPLMCVHRP